MTDEQFEKLMKQLTAMNKKLNQILDAIDNISSDTDILRKCLTETFDEKEKGTVWSIPSILLSIANNQ